MTTSLGSTILLCTASGKNKSSGGSIAIQLELVHGNVNYEGTATYVLMAEPTVLAASMSYMADQQSHVVLDYFASKVFAPFGSLDPTPQERNYHMELIIAIRFLQGWWQDSDFKVLLPQWVHDGTNMFKLFKPQQQHPEFPWATRHPVDAGPDLQYSIFSCYARTPSTPNVQSFMEAATDVHQKTMEAHPVNSVEIQPSAKRKRRRVHLHFEPPGATSNLKGQGESGPVGNDNVINVNLEGDFALKVFGIKFVTACNGHARQQRWVW
ncbi:hypothetical protein BJ741DRAFT_710939 [Chytriomyces cf. hyalinus JEL632]|nr:hypothetical protein BJ741DRAFT_710939 [Chytriomyces cf. hyalinus JEL632]